MNKNTWMGLRAVVVVRQSNDKDGTASTAAQLDYMSKELERVGLQYVDKLVLEGVRGSAPAVLTDHLNRLFQRKEQCNDFDVIAWQVEDRASRSGGEFGMWLQHEAKRRGLRIFFAGDEYDSVPYAPVVRVAKYEAAKDVSVSIGRRSTQGQKWAQKSGFFRTSGQTPIGCDRVYCGSDGQPKFIIHNLPNGLQQQLDFKTRMCVAEYGTVGKKSRNRFKKQRNEYSLLIPGDREQQKVVRVIFYLRFKRGWRGCRIADFLNRNGVRSPKGKEWSQRQVQIIYENEAYTGVTFNDQTFSGRFFRRDREMGFAALNRDECDLVKKRSFTPKLRPLDDWERIDQPYMYDFLPRDVRDLAITDHANMWRERTIPARPRKTPTAHPSSDYLLSGWLKAKQDGGTLIGTMSGPPGNKTPYYRHRRAKRCRLKGSVYNNLIPAEPIHDAILNVIADVLLDSPQLRERLHAHVIDGRSRNRVDDPNANELEKSKDEILRQINLIIASLTGAALASVQPELQRLGDRLNAIELQLMATRDKIEQDDRPINQVVEDAIRILQDDRQRLSRLPIEPLRALVNKLILNPVVDMATKAVEFEVALPTWALQAGSEQSRHKRARGQSAASEAFSSVCPPTTSRSQSGCWTQITLTRAICEYRWNRGSRVDRPCYECRRAA